MSVEDAISSSQSIANKAANTVSRSAPLTHSQITGSNSKMDPLEKALRLALNVSVVDSDASVVDSESVSKISEASFTGNGGNGGNTEISGIGKGFETCFGKGSGNSNCGSHHQQQQQQQHYQQQQQQQQQLLHQQQQQQQQQVEELMKGISSTDFLPTNLTLISASSLYFHFLPVSERASQSY